MDLIGFFKLGVIVTDYANGSAVLDALECIERPSAPLQFFVAGVASGYYSEGSAKELLAALGPGEAGVVPDQGL